LLLGGTVSVHAQEAEVTAAVRETLSAWSEEDYETFLSFYHPDARGFFLDGSGLIRGFDPAVLAAARDAGFDAEVELRDLEVQVLGTTAIAVGYISGTLNLPGGMAIEGNWRYSETRVLDGGVWKTIQFHFSELQGSGGD
jgi:ketosteroid isomerase-like protein